MVSNEVKSGQTCEEKNGGKSCNYPEVKYFRKRDEKVKKHVRKRMFYCMFKSHQKSQRGYREFLSLKNWNNRVTIY